jgi:hypothetical protein
MRIQRELSRIDPEEKFLIPTREIVRVALKDLPIEVAEDIEDCY